MLSDSQGTEVEVHEMVGSIRAMDQQQLLSPQIMGRIVGEVMRAIDERQAYRARVDAERRITSGVRDEQEGETV